MNNGRAGWESTYLRNVVSLKTGPFGSALHKADYVKGGVPLINPTHISSGRLIPAMDVTVTPDTARALADYRLEAGDVVMGRRGEMGRCAVVTGGAAGWLCGTGSIIVRPSTAMDSKYLQRFLSSPATVTKLNGDSVGSTMVNLNQGVLLGLHIPVPPLAEQERIADKLDTVLARVDAFRDRLDRVGALLKRFRHSVLAAATSGQLTKEWRVIRGEVGERRAVESTQLPTSWTRSCVELVATVSTGSTPLRSNAEFYASVGTPWVTSAATGNEFVRNAVEFVTEAAIKAHRLKLYPVGTLLVAMYGEGKTRGQVAELAIEATINQACAAIVVDETKALRSFVKLVLKANYLEMRELAEGGNQPNLNLSKVKAFPLALPPLEEQYEVTRRVNQLFAFADRLEARLAQAQASSDRLTPALLAKAFRGELVPQDPNDEPAAELLKRLHTRGAEEPKGRKKGRARTKAETGVENPTGKGNMLEELSMGG